ncbi:MAG: transposase [Accumulibacter sp.]
MKPHFPSQPITGRKRADNRKVINCILFVLITGCRWRTCLNVTVPMRLHREG